MAVFTSAGPIGVMLQTVLCAPEQIAIELHWRIRNCSMTELVFTRDRVSLDQLQHHAASEGGYLPLVARLRFLAGFFARARRPAATARPRPRTQRFGIFEYFWRGFVILHAGGLVAKRMERLPGLSLRTQADYDRPL